MREENEVNGQGDCHVPKGMLCDRAARSSQRHGMRGEENEAIGAGRLPRRAARSSQ